MAALVAMIENADDAEAADERDGQAALGVAHFAGDHGEIVPAVVGPERGDQRDHESAEAADGVGAEGGEVAPRAVLADVKQKPAMTRMSTPLSHGEDELEVAGLLDAEVVESGHEPGDARWRRPATRAVAGREPGAVEPWNAGKTPRVRARPMVTVAIEAGLATANHVHI